MAPDSKNVVSRCRVRDAIIAVSVALTCLVACSSSQPAGGGAGNTGREGIGGQGGIGAGSGGAAGAGDSGGMTALGGAGGFLSGPGGGDSGAAGNSGAPGAAGAPVRGTCTLDSDCVFRPDDSCCGSCVAANDAPGAPGPTCRGGAACAPPPGGCSCVDHVCVRGILAMDAPCDVTADMCGSGLKCCALCGPALTSSKATAGFAADCGAPICRQSMNMNGAWLCPQLVLRH